MEFIKDIEIGDCEVVSTIYKLQQKLYRNEVYIPVRSKSFKVKAIDSTRVPEPEQILCKLPGEWRTIQTFSDEYEAQFYFRLLKANFPRLYLDRLVKEEKSLICLDSTEP